MTKNNIANAIKMLLSDYKMDVVIKHHYQGCNPEQTCTSEYFMQHADEELGDFCYITELPVYALTKQELNQIYDNISDEKFTLLLEVRVDTFGDNADLERWNVIYL